MEAMNHEQARTFLADGPETCVYFRQTRTKDRCLIVTCWLDESGRLVRANSCPTGEPVPAGHKQFYTLSQLSKFADTGPQYYEGWGLRWHHSGVQEQLSTPCDAHVATWIEDVRTCQHCGFILEEIR